MVGDIAYGRSTYALTGLKVNLYAAKKHRLAIVDSPTRVVVSGRNVAGSTKSRRGNLRGSLGRVRDSQSHASWVIW